MNALKRNPDETRRKILEAAFEEVYRAGFQNASINRILESTGVTKGAFYHHFKTKNDLGYALVDEMLRQKIHEEWLDPLKKTDNPTAVLLESIQAKTKEADFEEVCRLGCPLNNLAQEMSGVDEEFRRLITTIYGEWIEVLTDALARGQKAGNIRTELNTKSTALLIVAFFEGSIGLAKNADDAKTFMTTLIPALFEYLNSLRPERTA